MSSELYSDVQQWLEQHQTAIVEQIVQRVRQEMSDYRTRPIDELSQAVKKSLIVWYTSIINEDFKLHEQSARQVIQHNLELKRDAEQVARTPLYVYNAVAEAIAADKQARDNQLFEAFLKKAKRATDRMVSIGRLQIANYFIQNIPDLKD